MTFRQLYDAALIECNKLKAPSLLLEDYNYLINKAVQQYVNQIYNRCEYNQQSTDDLSWLYKEEVIALTTNMGSLPQEYLHLLNCIGEFTKGQSGKNNYCPTSNSTSTINVNCQRLTADLEGGILNNYYMKPSAKKPYYFINNNSIKIESGNDICHAIKIKFIRKPIEIELTEEMLLDIDDNSSNCEFPDYVAYEIINIFTKLLLENAGDPRLQTNLPINQTIATPTNN